MLIDLHTHTSKYSNCSGMTGEQLAKAAVKAGLDGFVITEHNEFWKPDEIKSLKASFPKIKIFNAVEISVKEKEHILVYGVDEPHKLYRGMPLRRLRDIVEEYNGYMVLAHPFRYRDEVSKQIYNVNIDAVEVSSMNIRSYMMESIHRLKEKKNMSGVACSDAHSTNSVGVFATRFKSVVNDEKDLVAALKSKNFTLYKNVEFLKKQNEKMKEKIKLANKLISQGLTDREVRNKSGRTISVSMSYAVRNKKDICFPY